MRFVHTYFLTPDRYKRTINTTKGAVFFCGIFAAEETFTVTSDQARQRAEKSFRQEERARDARKAMTEYEAQAVAIREKTARLKALRLTKQAQAVDSKLER